MGLRDQFEKLRNYFIEDDDYEDYEDESELAEDTSYNKTNTQTQRPQTVRPQVQPTAQTRPSQTQQAANYSTGSVKRTLGSNSGMTSAYVSTTQPHSAAVLPQKAANVVSAAASPKITMTAPRVYQDIMEMGSLLRSGTTVIVNFKNMADQQARRSIDFLTGVAYILDGDIQNIGGQVFLITPTGVSVDGAKESLLASGGQGFENFDLTSY